MSVNGKKLRRPCLDRFAVFAKASRIFPSALNTAEFILSLSKGL